MITSKKQINRDKLLQATQPALTSKVCPVCKKSYAGRFEWCSTCFDFDYYIVAFSGGKDSLACVLHLLDLGVDRSKIELWHHDVDGREGSDLMDWPVTRDYCKKVAEAFNIPIYFSWKEGGFEGEMLRNNSRTRPVRFEKPDGTLGQAGGTRGRASTRMKFPQVTANLQQRWCSAYLKIDVCSIAINNQKRFVGRKTLLISGERAQESSSRSKYSEFEDDRCMSKKRFVKRLRPIHKWLESDVWRIIKKHKVNPHPAYNLGYGRLSCMFCIFGDANQWATNRKISPKRFSYIENYENKFKKTIHRSKTVKQLADEGTPYYLEAEALTSAKKEIYELPVFVETWELPSGSYANTSGPT